MSSAKCWGLNNQNVGRCFLVWGPCFLIIVDIVGISVFKVLEVVERDETCFTPSFPAIFLLGVAK
jgi:hypothetical protein